jgi:cytochrome c-type biogenesis protein CcmF
MIVEFGHFAVVLALALAIVQMTLPAWGARIGDRRLMAVAEPAALTQLGLLVLAFAALTHAYVTLRLLGRERVGQLALGKAAHL